MGVGGELVKSEGRDAWREWKGEGDVWREWNGGRG